MSWEGKNVVISGGTRGIGRAVAEKFLEVGARVVVCSEEDPPHEWDELAAGGAHHIREDLSTVDGPRRMIREASRLLGGRLHYLVYFAGVYPEGNPGDATVEQLWDHTYFVKVRGSYLAALEFVELPADDGEDTAILFVSSINARQSEPDHLAYDGACAAVEGQMRSFAVQFASRGIRCNCLAPGLIDTRLTKCVVDVPHEHDHARRCIPLGRIGDPVDCAGAALFLCSDAAHYITGQILTVDGGIEALQAPPAPPRH